MRRLCLSILFVVLFFIGLFGGADKEESTKIDGFYSFDLLSEGIVYICTGHASECYHKTEDCRGLRNCSDDIIEVSLEDAEDKFRRRPCGYCYGRRR